MTEEGVYAGSFGYHPVSELSDDCCNVSALAVNRLPMGAALIPMAVKRKIATTNKTFMFRRKECEDLKTVDPEMDEWLTSNIVPELPRWRGTLRGEE